jgi:hypothetical protein
MMHSRIDGDMTSLRFSMCDVLFFFFFPFEKLLDKDKGNVFLFIKKQSIMMFYVFLVENKNQWHHLDYSIVLVREVTKI